MSSQSTPRNNENRGAMYSNLSRLLLFRQWSHQRDNSNLERLLYIFRGVFSFQLSVKRELKTENCFSVEIYQFLSHSKFQRERR